jgi:hypothetical protein
VLGSLFGFSFCGITLIFLYILSVYLEAHCAFFDIYNITYKKKRKKEIQISILQNKRLYVIFVGICLEIASKIQQIHSIK